MKEKKAIHYRLVIELMVSLLFLAGLIVYIHTSNLKAELRIKLMVRVDLEVEDNFQLFIGKDPPVDARVKPSNRIQGLRFNLPGKKLRNLRIVLGQTPGRTVIRSLSVKGWFKSYTIRGKQLKNLFPDTDSSTTYSVSKRNLIIQTNKPRFELVPRKAFYNALDQMQTGRALFYLPALGLTFLLFYLLHSLDLRFCILRGLIKRKLVTNGVLIIGFMLLLPLLTGIFNTGNELELAETRGATNDPEFRFDAVFSFLDQYSNYYNRNFSYRSQLIYLNNYLTVKCFGISPTSRLLMGKNNWLFLDEQPNRPGTINYYRSLTLFNQAELDAWKNLLEQRRAWLAQQGILYLFLIVPNKNSIYPEYMPDYIRKVNKRSRMDQLLDYLKNNSSISTVDIRPALLAAKKKAPVFQATDTHWNDYGAFIAAGEIMKTIAAFPEYAKARPLPLDRFKMQTINHSGGDLAAMLSLQEEVMREDMIDLTPVPDWQYTGGGLKRISLFIKQGYTVNPNALLPNLVMVHDSFYKKLKPFLSEQFTRIRYIWDWDMGFFPGIIEKENPKLVIDEMAERFLLDKMPVNPDGI